MSKELNKRIFSTIILIPFSFYFIIQGSLFFNFFMLVCFLITSNEWYKMSKSKNYLFFGYLFLSFSFYSTYELRNTDVMGSSLYIFFFILIICISTDIGGYVFGKILKGPKLSKVSPKKTYSGTIGGYFLSIISTYILINYSEIFFSIKVEFTIENFICILLISSVSQIGDLIISSFKRLSKIKDTGNIIPGHGGLLDRIDGMIFAFPFSYVLFSLNILK